MKCKRTLVAVLAIVALAGGLASVQSGAGVASAQTAVASVACTGSAPGLADCTITLTSAIAAGGAFTATATDSGATILACNTIPAGGPCALTPATATFSCPSGCNAGATFRDVLQLSQGSGQDQTFTATGALAISSSSLPNPTTAVAPLPFNGSASVCFTPQGLTVACGGSGLVAGSSCFALGISISCGGLGTFSSGCYSQGLLVNCASLPATSNCFIGSVFGVLNNCATISLVGLTNGCLVPSVSGLVNLCGNALSVLPQQGCLALSPTGVTVNLCGFQQFTTTNNIGLLGANCTQVVNTLGGPVAVRVC